MALLPPSACARTLRGGGRHDGSARAPTGTGTRGSDAIVVEATAPQRGVDLESSSARARLVRRRLRPCNIGEPDAAEGVAVVRRGEELGGLRGERGECMAPARRKNLLLVSRQVCQTPKAASASRRASWLPLRGFSRDHEQVPAHPRLMHAHHGQHHHATKTVDWQSGHAFHACLRGSPSPPPPSAPSALSSPPGKPCFFVHPFFQALGMFVGEFRLPRLLWRALLLLRWLPVDPRSWTAPRPQFTGSSSCCRRAST